MLCDQTAFCSTTLVGEALSLVAPTDSFRDQQLRARRDGWRCLRLDGTFELNETGILVSVVVPLAEAGISVYALATFSTDFILIRDEQLATARAVLSAAGHMVHD